MTRTRDRGDPAKMSMRTLCTSLQPGQLWACLVALFGLLAGAFTAGLYVERLTANRGQSSIDWAAETAPTGAAQREIRSRPAVRVFERFLNSATAEKWGDAWKYMASTWRDQMAGPDDLAYEYRMTKSHTFSYYIPMRITPREERYLIDFQFEDLLPNLPVRYSTVRSPIEAALKPELFQQLLTEYAGALGAAYRPLQAGVDLRQTVQDAASTWTVRDLVMNDALIERLGKSLKWTPIIPSGVTGSGEAPATSKRMLVEAVVIREDDVSDWKVARYDAITIDKR